MSGLSHAAGFYLSVGNLLRLFFGTLSTSIDKCFRFQVVVHVVFCKGNDKTHLKSIKDKVAQKGSACPYIHVSGKIQKNQQL